MQLMIDILAETPAALRLASQFLHEHALLREAMEDGAGLPPGNVPTGTRPEVPAAPLATSAPSSIATAANVPAPPPLSLVPPPPPPIAPTAGYPSSVAPPAPTTAPPASMPSVPSVMTPAMSVPPSPSTAAPASPGASGAPAAADEYDTSGVPWDGRIHQKGKSVKKDGTWKLQKNIDQAIVTAVMAELSTRIRHPGSVAPTAPSVPPVSTAPVPGASPAPVSLPPVPPPPIAGTPAVAQNIAAQTPLAPPPPIPAANQVPPPPIAEAQDADPFRKLVAKITAHRAAQAITPQEVTQCVTAAGAPSLQLLNNMPHLIPAVEANIDALLATR